MPEPAAAPPRRIMPVLILAEFAGTSLWFAGNAVMGDLQHRLHLPATALGGMTSAVQFGFIAGTLCFAWFAWADRFSPSRLFCTCALLGALANLLLVPAAPFGLPALLALRAATGFFLAGIYPVGMKIAVAWYRQEAGKAIGFLAGALVLGTAFPHLLRALETGAPWSRVIGGVSLLAAAGGLLLLALVPDGPHLPPGGRPEPGALRALFRDPGFRRVAWGYFGHMWELYAFWTFLPVLLAAYAARHHLPALPIALWSFAVIAAGALGCVGGGLLSRRLGSLPVAAGQLTLSGLLCLLAPLLFAAPPRLFFSALLLWGVAVVGDSPQFSALAAGTAPPHRVGTGLTIVYSLGFAITIVSIELLSRLGMQRHPALLFPLLGVGPALGLLALWPLRRQPAVRRLGRRL